MLKEQLVGTWRLVSSEYLNADGELVHPFGEDHIGMFMFDARGHVMAVSGSRGRPMFASGNRQNASPEEIKAAFDGFTAYYGTYNVDEEEKAITFHTELHVFPNGTGTETKRALEIQGDCLVFRHGQLATAWTSIATGMVTWERIG